MIFFTLLDLVCQFLLKNFTAQFTAEIVLQFFSLYGFDLKVTLVSTTLHIVL